MSKKTTESIALETTLDTTQGQPVLESNEDASNADVLQFVTFVAGNEVFAVDMTPVQEIIRVPDIVRVPLSPAALDGLSNLRGKVLPIISLRKIFGFHEASHDDATRALVIDIGQPLGFVVDKVSSVGGVDKGKIEGVEGISGTVKTELLSGIIKDVNGHPMIMVIDFAKVIAQEFTEIEQLAKAASMSAGFTNQAQDTEEGVLSDELQLVSFEVYEQEYAIAIENVQEIVQLPEQIVHVPNAESHVLGVMTLRNRLLPLVSLRRLFSLPTLESNEHSRIVVIAIAGVSVGVVVDSVNEVLRVAKAAVDPMPALLTRDGEMADISQICRLDQGKRLVSIISAAHLFNHSHIKEALKTVTIETDEVSESTQELDINDADDEVQVVVFRLDKEEFGVSIDSVQEIVRVPEELTHVPKAPTCVEGVINLRGAVLPVIDLRRRLSMENIERSDRQRIMVFLIDGLRTGFIVDSVAEVLKIHKSSIEDSPKLSSEQALLLSRMANLEKQKRMIQLIEPDHLIGSRDVESLSKLVA